MRMYVSHLIDKIRSVGIETGRGAEIGVWEGKTSMALLRHFPDLILYMIDAWGDELDPCMDEHMDSFYEKCPAAKKRALKMTGFASDRRVVIHDSSRNASLDVLDGSLDFVFIDANHTYESAAEDIKLWYPKVRLGGLFSGHDYDKKWGVKRAVDEFASEHNYKFSVFKRTWTLIKVP